MLNSDPVSKIEEIQFSPLHNSGIRLFVLRDDLIHPFLSGNKWRKLKYNIPDILKEPNTVMVTFGGAWSNHLIASAAAGKIYGFETIGIVRGEEGVMNDALRFAQKCGMNLYYISREEYRKRKDPEFLSHIENNLRIFFPSILQNKNIFHLPEGGSNAAAVKGCEEIPSAIPMHTDYICCACGTGATLAGIARGLKHNQKALGIPVLKAESFMQKDVMQWNVNPENFELHFGYSFGGYAKFSTELINFCHDFSKETNVPIEPVYTGKLFFALTQLIRQGYFIKGSVITAVHSGGLYDFTKEC